MANTFFISIKTPQKTVYEGRIQSLVAPGIMGYLGVLANHAPFITSLVPGRITLRDDGGKALNFASAGSGILEVLKNNATLLLDSAESQS